MLDLAMNAHGVAVEERYARPILSSFHASFSFGGLVGAVAGGVAAAAGISPLAQFTGAAVVIGLAVIPALGQSMRPEFEERDLLISWDGAPGTSRPEMSRISALASEELRSIPGVRDVGAHVGRAITSDQVVEINSGELWVSKVTLHPEIRYVGAQPTADQRERMHHKAHEVCFIANSVKTEIVVEEKVSAG